MKGDEHAGNIHAACTLGHSASLLSPWVIFPDVSLHAARFETPDKRIFGMSNPPESFHHRRLPTEDFERCGLPRGFASTSDPPELFVKVLVLRESYTVNSRYRICGAETVRNKSCFAQLVSFEFGQNGEFRTASAVRPHILCNCQRMGFIQRKLVPKTLVLPASSHQLGKTRVLQQPLL